MSEPYVGTLRWFGRTFDSPMYEGMPKAPPLPPDARCLQCREPILPGEPGVTMPYIDGKGHGHRAEPIHIECHIRSVVGSPAHLSGLCSCNTDHPPDEDAGLTYRQEALRSIELFWGSDWACR